MSEPLRRRAAEIRARALTRSWRYRQRVHASGVWERLRWVLAHAERAWAVDLQTVAILLEEGFVQEPVSHELAPPKPLLFVPVERALALEGAPELALHLDVGFWGAPALALVRFPAAGRAAEPCPVDSRNSAGEIPHGAEDSSAGSLLG